MNGRNGNHTPKRRRDSGEWRPAFLAALAETGNVRLSCEQAHVQRRTAYDHRDADPEFRAAWETALNEAIDTLEKEARRRAMESSDVLLIFLLKAHRPAMYRERFGIDHSGSINFGTLADGATKDQAEYDRRLNGSSAS